MGPRSSNASTTSAAKKGSKSKKTKKKGRQNKTRNVSQAKHIEANIKHGAEIDMDIFDTTSASGFINPMKGGGDGESRMQSTFTTPEQLPTTIDPNLDVHTDPTSGKRYTVNRLTSESQWLEDDENPNLALL